MEFDLPYGNGLASCNSKSITSISNKGLEIVDGGTAKCKNLDSQFYDLLVTMGHRGRDLISLIEADWIVSKNNKNNELFFSYINPTIGSIDFLMGSNFSISGRNISGVSSSDGVKYKIKVGPSASKNIKYILENREKF